jgi:hypothetical protein
MSDQNMQDFYARVGRLNQAHAEGRGFEVGGLLDRPHYIKPQRKPRRRIFWPVAGFLMLGMALKIGVYSAVGAQTYQDRVLQVTQASGELGQISAMILAPDIATIWLADMIRTLVAAQS